MAISDADRRGPGEDQRSSDDSPRPGETLGIPDADLRIPDDETPVRCPHCGRPFRSTRLRALHLGDAHPADCTDDQQTAYESALESERDDLFLYHLKVVAGLVAVYAFFLLTYMAVSAMQAPG